MALDQDKGVWKSAKGKGRRTPKGRQFEDEALNEVKALLENRPRQKDLYLGLMPCKFSPDLCTKVYNQNELFKT